MELQVFASNVFTDSANATGRRKSRTAGGIPISPVDSPQFSAIYCTNPELIRLRLELEKLKLLRGFDELLCL